MGKIRVDLRFLLNDELQGQTVVAWRGESFVRIYS